MYKTIKEFMASGNYFIEEVKNRCWKGSSPYFFNKQEMKYFSSRISDLCWKVNDDIYFITSEKDNGRIKHRGSKRGWTIRICNNIGNINTVGEFQEHASLSIARKALLDIIPKYTSFPLQACDGLQDVVQ